MASKNEKTALAALDAFNRGDLDASVASYAETGIFVDAARGLTMKTRQEVRDWQAEWIAAFSDAKVTEIETYDAGDTVVVELVGRGTNDGPLGPFPATGRRASVPMCSILHFDAQGRIVAEEDYYDQLSLLVQLGHAAAPTA